MKTFIPQQSYTCKAEGGERARAVVIFIHGITEGTEQFRQPAAWAAEMGMDSVALLLPGHGGTAGSFARSGRKQWEDCVYAEVERCRRAYGRVFLVGHSMGGLLSILSWLRCADRIAGVAVISCPFHVRVTGRAVRHLLKVRYPSGTDSPEVEAMRRAVNVAPGPTLAYLRWLPRLRDLFAMMREVRRGLSRLRVPLLVVQGMRDELVDARRSLRCCRGRVPQRWLRVLELPRSTHFLYAPAEWVGLREALEEMMAER